VLKVAFALAAALAALATLGGSASAASPSAPTSSTQPLTDGCQRSVLGIGFDTSPEWVYVYRDPTIRMAQGVVRVAHASLQDSIRQHRSFDFTANLVPDPAFRYLLGGSPTQRTGNFAPTGGEEQGRLHFEWESATLPLFAWPTDGDRATIWGSWIWDCGHWTSDSGAVTGEHTELHPLNAIVVQRRAPYTSARGESEADVFVSSEGDGAHAVERCALTHSPLAGGAFSQYDAGFEPCATAVSNRVQPLASSYTFTVPAPPKPSRSARLRYRIVNRIGGGAGSQRVRVTARGIQVTVRLRGESAPVRYGKSFYVSWSVPPASAPVPLNVTLKSILVRHADPNPAVPDPSGAHWALYLDLNGYWQLLNGWVPRLTSGVRDGERFAVGRTVRIYVPHGARVWLQVAGRECDEPAGKAILGVFANLLYPCPANTDEQNPNLLDLFNNDDTGTILDTYRSAAAAIGTHTSTSVATTTRFPGSGAITFGDGKQGQGGYQLTYTIRRG
jgi:hypothetical protein